MPYFFQVGAWQYADIPLAFFELATVVCVIHAFGYEAQPGTARNRGRGAWILTGLCAGGALWTKDEGAIFVAALFVAIAGVGLWREPASHVLRRVSSVGLGLLPAVVALIALKVRHPFPNDIFGNLSGATVKRLFYLEWHAALLSQLRQAVSSSSDRIPMLLVLCYAVVAAAQGGRGGLLSLPSSERTGWAASALCLILLAGGLYCAYLISPHAIAWQVANSAERLRLQLLPSALFVGFVALPPAERVLGSGRR